MLRVGAREECMRGITHGKKKKKEKKGERVSEDFWKVTQRGEMMRKEYIKVREGMTDEKREVEMGKGGKREK